MPAKPKPAPMSDSMTPRPFTVVARRQDLSDTFTIELKPGDGGDQICFQPGQFNMLYTFGVGEVPISISGDPQQPERLVHTVRAAGKVAFGKAARRGRPGRCHGTASKDR